MLITILFALVTIVILKLFSYDRANDLMSCFLAGTGFIYVGFAISDGRTEHLAIEIAAAVVFLAVALIGRWYSIYLLGAGYIMHGIWDILHHWIIDTEVVHWYPDICLVYDVIIGLYIIGNHYIRMKKSLRFNKD